MAVKHNVYNPVTGKPELKTFKSEREYREFRQRPEQRKWNLAVDVKVYAEGANKRLERLEQRGLTKSPAYKQAIHQIHLITGDKSATRFPSAGKSVSELQKMSSLELQKEVQPAFKVVGQYETATPAGYTRAQKRARKGFNKALGKPAKKLSQSQYDILTDMADVLRDMFGALVPGSTQMFNGLIDSVANQFDDDDIREFAMALDDEFTRYSGEEQEYLREDTRHFLSVGIDMFAHGIVPDAHAIVTNQLVKDKYKWQSKGLHFNLPEDNPYT